MNQILAGHLNFEGGIKQGKQPACLCPEGTQSAAAINTSQSAHKLTVQLGTVTWCLELSSQPGKTLYMVKRLAFSFLLFCFFCANLAILIFLICISLLDYLLAVVKRQLSLELMFWIPMFTPQVVNLIRDLDTDFSILGKNYINVIQVSSHLFAMSSACYNPFIYASLHNKFLSYLCLHFLPWRKGKAKDRRQGSSVLTVSHRMPRLYTSTIAADLPGVVANNADPQENYT